MRTRTSGMLAVSIFVALASTGCQSCQEVDQALKNVVVFQYDHIANIQEIRFNQNLQVSAGSVGSVRAREGFWAVFVLCSLDVQGQAVQTFNYDVSKFSVAYDAKTFGPLQPGGLNYGAGVAQNTAADTPKVVVAIADVVQLGPSTQPFPHGFFPSLNYRIAVLVNEALPRYIGEQLTLKYDGQPSILQGRGRSPVAIQAYGGGFGGVLSGGCRQPL